MTFASTYPLTLSGDRLLPRTIQLDGTQTALDDIAIAGGQRYIPLAPRRALPVVSPQPTTTIIDLDDDEDDNKQGMSVLEVVLVFALIIVAIIALVNRDDDDYF